MLPYKAFFLGLFKKFYHVGLCKNYMGRNDLLEDVRIIRSYLLSKAINVLEILMHYPNGAEEHLERVFGGRSQLFAIPIYILYDSVHALEHQLLLIAETLIQSPFRYAAIRRNLVHGNVFARPFLLVQRTGSVHYLILLSILHIPFAFKTNQSPFHRNETPLRFFETAFRENKTAFRQSGISIRQIKAIKTHHKRCSPALVSLLPKTGAKLQKTHETEKVFRV